MNLNIPKAELHTAVKGCIEASNRPLESPREHSIEFNTSQVIKFENLRDRTCIDGRGPEYEVVMRFEQPVLPK